MKSKYTVKMLETNHIEQALALVWSVFLEFEAPDYGPQGVQEFKNYIAYENIISLVKERTLILWGCFHNDSIIGIIAGTPPDHISLLFVDKAYHRQGIAKQLLAKLEEYFAKLYQCSRITVNASLYGAGAYRKMGFLDTDTEQTINGIRFIPMVKTI